VGEWFEFKTLNKEEIRADREVKFKKFDDLYKRLRTKERGKEIYKLGKIHENRFRICQNVLCMKGEDNKVLTI